MSPPTSPLEAHARRLRTRMGGAFVGQRAVFRGQDLHVDLADMDWMALYVFGITGQRYTPAQIRVLHAIWVYTSYPDARIWNNRVAALAGSARSSGNLGVAAALAVSEAEIYGRGIDIRAASFVQRAAQVIEAGASLDDCVRDELQRHRAIAGYGRPIAAGDERIAPILRMAEREGLAQGPHVRAAQAVEQHLQAGRWRLRMNYAAITAALTSDMGFTPRQHYQFGFPAFLAGMQPCYIEASEQPAGTLLPLACDDVAYEGPAARRWP
ncbi:citrate/2-methylcitrate synthase [Pelomonas cellulosilytica]|uniref:Citryl-CoA lyase n=1 Tax=Pelomonas cellulosilytica TaxID=2906762 RepID=A0ABS8Y1Q7_9BURK|nr:citrate/2-methylcitrate synthase [Pelomonas sp. P8]MCE4557598.1 hypothetical protein [Pelomonas sp. P8]